MQMITLCHMKATIWITVLEIDSLTLIDWFTENQMKANPDKFQAIAIGKKN